MEGPAKNRLHSTNSDLLCALDAILFNPRWLRRLAEMATGEGKTLVASLASYLNALEGKGVHVVTVNDYLAR
jgi:hypothetical protein